MQVRERVCEGFTRLGPDSCSCTWDRTPVDRENHGDSWAQIQLPHVFMSESPRHSPLGADTRKRKNHSGFIFLQMRFMKPRRSLQA